jgi:hypothetical protein
VDVTHPAACSGTVDMPLWRESGRREHEVMPSL